MSVVRYIHQNPLQAGVVSNMDRYRWSSHQGYLYKRKRPEWLNTEFVLSRFSRLRDYQEFMHCEIEKEVLDFYRARPWGRSPFQFCDGSWKDTLLSFCPLNVTLLSVPGA